MDRTAPVALRAAVPDDMPFVLDAWCRSYRVSPWAGTVRNDQFHEVQRSTILGLLARGARLVVATAGEGLVGFICWEPGVLHYAYVKHVFRRLGVGWTLLREMGALGPGRFTHRTRASEALLRRGWQWDPRPARVLDPGEQPPCDTPSASSTSSSPCPSPPAAPSAAGRTARR